MCLCVCVCLVWEVCVLFVCVMCGVGVFTSLVWWLEGTITVSRQLGTVSYDVSPNLMDLVLSGWPVNSSNVPGRGLCDHRRTTHTV